MALKCIRVEFVNIDMGSICNTFSKFFGALCISSLIKEIESI